MVRKFSGWLSLINDSYGPELWETIHADYPIHPCRSPEQVMRSKRLFHILQQQFTGYSKIENLVRSQISATGITDSNGFELLRLIRKEFSLMSRTEALSYREQCLKFRVKRSTEHLLDIIREVEAEIESFHAMLDASVIVHQFGAVRISEGDQFLLYLRNLPSKVQEFLQLHQNATTVLQLKLGVQDYHRGPINRGTNFKQEYGPETGLTAAHQILRHLHKDLAPISGTLQGRDQFPG